MSYKKLQQCEHAFKPSDNHTEQPFSSQVLSAKWQLTPRSDTVTGPQCAASD